MPNHLFVYGTLHPTRAPRHLADIVSRFTPLSPGTVRGHLHKLPRYPALVLDPNGPKVPGEIFTLPNDPIILPCLDRYEGYDPADPAASLFLRVQIPVTLPDGSQQTCWLYTYNRRLP